MESIYLQYMRNVHTQAPWRASVSPYADYSSSLIVLTAAGLWPQLSRVIEHQHRAQQVMSMDLLHD